ncbi:thioredoxin-like 1-2, chloroplastic [Mangifera indica]|uniref:thioredoxin-like 1-2, chloroplastic n=1 Tax=Mangifera indica TaxID=29780 RepID=UPI001CFBB6AD|nr:thioredoxin-like 1-2, chloroplastic [Mangifera indica]
MRKMSCSLKSGLYISGPNETLIPSSKSKGVVGFLAPFSHSQFRLSKTRSFPGLSVDFNGRPLVVSDQKRLRDCNTRAPKKFSAHAEASVSVSRSLRWWQKTLKPNMIEIHSAQELVDSLLNGGDKLVVVDFYSPGCGGCKALHPKICQLAELHPDAIFLKVNYEELRTMCQSLHIHVLPFFRLYRGADGHLCSFSCTNATIKKFKDAIAKHGTERCSIGATKGLNQSELLKLASIGELSMDLPLTSTKEERVEDLVVGSIDLCGVLRKADNLMDMELEARGASV